MLPNRGPGRNDGNEIPVMDLKFVFLREQIHRRKDHRKQDLRQHDQRAESEDRKALSEWDKARLVTFLGARPRCDQNRPSSTCSTCAFLPAEAWHPHSKLSAFRSAPSARRPRLSAFSSTPTARRLLFDDMGRHQRVFPPSIDPFSARGVAGEENPTRGMESEPRLQASGVSAIRGVESALAIAADRGLRLPMEVVPRETFHLPYSFCGTADRLRPIRSSTF